MAQRYDQEAIEICRKLYIQHGGKNHDAIETAMRKAGYEGWKKQNLFNRGAGSDARLGWIERYGFEKSNRDYLKAQVEDQATDEVQKLYQAIKKVRETLQTKMTGGHSSRDEMFSFRDFCKLEMDALNKLNLSRDNYETFVAVWEKILSWLTELAPAAAISLIAGDTAEKLLERAKAEYGDEEKQQSAS